MSGVELVLLHPRVAFRDCETCKKYVFNEETGEVERNDVTGEPLERPPGTFPPCHYGPQECAKGSPDSGLSLNPQNMQAFLHYRECRAVGKFPNDPIVRENAAAIRQIEDQVAEINQLKFVSSILTVAHGG